MRRRLSEFLRGLVALVFTVALIGGVPLALVEFVGWPLPRSLPTWDELQRALTSTGIDDTIVINTLAIIVWLAWVQLTISLVVETVALVRSRPARAAPVLPGFQDVAANLLAATALLASSISLTRAAPVAASMAVAAGSIEVAVPIDAEPGADDPAVPGGSDAVAGSTRGPRYVVQEHDTLWSIAEETLGDGLRWKEIRDHNVGRRMPGGNTITATTETVQPGWELVMPAGATVPDDSAGESVSPDRDQVGPTRDASDEEREAAAAWVTVAVGDHFWGLAQQQLAEAWGRAPTDDEVAPYWRELVNRNAHRLLPPRDPNLIYPEQRFHLPPVPSDPGATDDVLVESEPAVDVADARDEVDTRGGAEAPTDASSAPEASELAPAPAATVDPAERGPGTDDGTPPIPQPVPGIVPEAPERVEPAPPPTASSKDGDASGREAQGAAVPAAAVAGGLGLLAAGVVALMNRLRAQRLRRRRPGVRPAAPPPETADVERSLRAAADIEATDLISLALRAMAADLIGTGELPVIVGVNVDDAALTVLLDEPRRLAPAGFEVGDDGRSWTLPRTTPVEYLERQAAGAPNPLPALVTVGHTPESQLLLDLEHLEVAEIHGRADDVAATMRTMVLELATSPLADSLDIVCVGIGHDLHAFERVEVVASPEELLIELRSRADHVADVLMDGTASPLAGRLSRTAGDTWTPTIVFDPTDRGEQSDRLIDLARRTPGGVTAVVGCSRGAEWQLHLDGGQVEIARLGDLRLTRHNLTNEQLDQVAALIGSAGDVEHVEAAEDLLSAVNAGPAMDEPHRDTEPNEPGEHDVDDKVVVLDERQPDIEVRLLGTIHIDGAEKEFRLSKAPEAVAYLVLHPRGVEADTVMEALWPNEAPDNNRLNRVVSHARVALGVSSAGERYLPRIGADGLYRVTPEVGCDLLRFLDVVKGVPGRHRAEVRAELRHALELVEGEPFRGAGRGYGWAYTEGWVTEAVVAIDEAARTLASLCLEAEDLDGARWAARQGLKGSPGNEELYRLLMRTAIAAGNRTELDAVFSELVAQVELDAGPGANTMLEPETTELYESYRPGRDRERAASVD